MIIIRILSHIGFPRLRVLSCQVLESDAMARVLAPQLCSRSRFGGVRVTFIRILQYGGGVQGEGRTWTWMNLDDLERPSGSHYRKLQKVHLLSFCRR